MTRLAHDTPMSTEQFDLATRLAAQLRVDSIRSSTRAGSGHPTSSLSAADLMAPRNVRSVTTTLSAVATSQTGPGSLSGTCSFRSAAPSTRPRAARPLARVAIHPRTIRALTSRVGSSAREAGVRPARRGPELAPRWRWWPWRHREFVGRSLKRPPGFIDDGGDAVAASEGTVCAARASGCCLCSGHAHGLPVRRRDSRRTARRTGSGPSAEPGSEMR
jgi:hypothetical protein